MYCKACLKVVSPLFHNVTLAGEVTRPRNTEKGQTPAVFWQSRVHNTMWKIQTNHLEQVIVRGFAFM